MHPRLEAIAEEIAKIRWAALILDDEWRLRWVSEELKILMNERDEDKLGYGKHIVAAWCSETWMNAITPESQIDTFLHGLPCLISETSGGKEAIMAMLPEPMAPFLAEIEPAPMPEVMTHSFDFLQEGFDPSRVAAVMFRVYDDGKPVGAVELYGPSLPAPVLALVARGDEGMFMRMARLVEPGRRQAAVVFSDLQDSGLLSRRLPSAAYFKLIRAITNAMDEVVVGHEGIVGKHAGDGATAFFLADDLGSSSAAARAAIASARAIAESAAKAAKEIGDETGLIEAADCRINVGVHWGGTLYMGQLVTGGRLEVTALGDAVNECARIQESARDGEVLVSKALIEHLTNEDARALGIDPDAVVYRTIGELPGAGDKAKRDAGSLPVTTL